MKNFFLFFLALSFFYFFLAFSKSYASKFILYTEDDNYGKVNQEKIWILSFGNPAFGDFWNTKVPKKFFLKTPENKEEKLVLIRRELFNPWFNAPRIAYNIKVQPKIQGDYLLCLEGEDTLREEKITTSYIKAIFHVEKEGNWDRLCGFPLEIKVFTRPYGLKKGVLFWGQVLLEGEPLTNGTIEVERLRLKLNPQKLLKASTEEINLPIYKKTVKIDERGYFFTNFEEEGWWVINSSTLRGIKLYGNKNYPHELRIQLWLYIFPSDQALPQVTKKSPSKKPKKTKKD